jgi:hypothetical protein
VDILHPGGERVVARKASADDEDFTLEDIPEGREVRSAWTVNSLANSLSALTLDAVAEEGDVNWADATRFGLVTADGLRVDVELASSTAPGAEAGEADEAGESAAPEYWIRLRAGLYQTALDSAVELPGDSGDDQDSAAGEDEGEPQGAPDETTSDDPAERARDINERVSGWAYRIPKYKADSMNKRLEDLLQPAEEPDD